MNVRTLSTLSPTNRYPLGPFRQTDEHSLNSQRKVSNSRKEVKEKAAVAIGIDLWYH
ncbi:hypothetical protein BofuT4_P015090.1 [Botrytis cinerea T4]|uniref:Uncharacterized protein n=1 Tax=Botryotinia fuckeliana (strain T4) TaxID=999810 RepID=G2XNC5_BOTF4|nr:hypothetical protein BofuT4_P015090.1 [Botrytis cinerea T4]